MASQNPPKTTGERKKAVYESITIQPQQHVELIRPLEMITMGMSKEDKRELDKVLIQHCVYVQNQMNLGYFKDDDPAKIIPEPDKKDHSIVSIEQGGKYMEITTTDALAVPIRIAFNTINRETLLMRHHHKYIPRHFLRYHKFRLHHEVFKVSYFN